MEWWLSADMWSVPHQFGGSEDSWIETGRQSQSPHRDEQAVSECALHNGVDTVIHQLSGDQQTDHSLIRQIHLAEPTPYCCLPFSTDAAWSARWQVETHPPHFGVVVIVKQQLLCQRVLDNGFEFPEPWHHPAGFHCSSVFGCNIFNTYSWLLFSVLKKMITLKVKGIFFYI